MTRRVSSTKHFTMVRNQLHPHDFTSTYMCVYTAETLLETETVDVDTTIITFTATDRDQPGTDNSRVYFYVNQRDDNQLFILNSTTV